MNIAIGTSNNTWNTLKSRYVVGIGGIALAIGIAIGGVSALPRTNHEARVAPPASSQPSTLFATAADAAFAAQGPVAVSPTFGTTWDAVDALPSLASLEASIAPTYATMSDAVDALRSIAPAAVAVSPSFGTMSDAVDQLANLAAQEAMLAPAFATMSDAVDALSSLAPVAVSSSAVAPLYANSADAVDASLVAIGYAPVTIVAKSESPLFGTMSDAVNAGEQIAGLPVEYSALVALQLDSIDWVQSQVLAVETAKVSSPQFANAADAYDASIALALETATSVSPLYVNMADAVDASLGGFPLVQEISHPQFAPVFGTEEEAVYNLGAYPLVQEYSHPQVSEIAPAQSEAPLFGTMADADYASR